MQFRYGTHWAPTHPNDVDGELTEIELGKDEVLTHVTAGTGAVIDNIQFATNARSFPTLGHQAKYPNQFISSAEILYFTGSEYTFTVLRVSALAALTSTCSTK